MCAVCQIHVRLFIPLLVLWSLGGAQSSRNLLKETIRNPVDLGISSDLCKIVVYTDGGAAFRPGESAVASWGFAAVLMCGNEAVCVIGCASGQFVLDRSHPEFLGGTKLTNNVGELQAMCCAVLWLIEQNRIDASMLTANTQRLRLWERSVAR